MKIEVSLSVDNVFASIQIEDEDYVSTALLSGASDIPQARMALIDQSIEKLGRMVRVQISPSPILPAPKCACTPGNYADDCPTHGSGVPIVKP